MSSKANRKDLLRSSIKNEADSVDKRFEAAEEAMEGRPLGLVGPRVPAGPAARDLRAEIAAEPSETTVLRVPLESAHDNPMNARQIYDPEAVKSLAASLGTRGQLVPAPAVWHPEKPGHVILIDGHYRKRALQACGRSEIEVVIKELASELDMYRMSYLINEERNAQSPLDNALAWGKLLEEKKVADNEGIAEMIGMSPALVAKTMALLKLPKAALAKMKETPSKFGPAIGYEVYRCSKSMPEQSLLSLMDRIVAEDLSSRAIEALRVKLEDAKPRKKKEVSRQYRINAGKDQIGFIKEWDSGKVAFEVNFADPKDREALVEELKRRFSLSESA
jgi:ParB family chromosome partitioning protein